jgi:hypothetical protein
MDSAQVPEPLPVKLCRICGEAQVQQVLRPDWEKYALKFRDTPGNGRPCWPTTLTYHTECDASTWLRIGGRKSAESMGID